MAEVSTWVVYAPLPGAYCHRAVEWVSVDGQVRQGPGTAFGTLDMLRGLFKTTGLECLGRDPSDDESIVEVWW